jgi:hypothetical protein
MSKETQSHDSAGLPDRLVPPEVTSDILAIGLSTLAAWRSEGCGPKFVKLSAGRSGAVRYPLSEVMKFAADPTGYCARPKATFRKPALQRDGQPRLNTMKARSRRGKTRGQV